MSAIVLYILFGSLFGACLFLFRFCRHLQNEMSRFSGIAIRTQELYNRLIAGRERGADMAGLRRRVEAMERDVDEMDATLRDHAERLASMKSQLPPEIAKLNPHFQSRIVVDS